MDLNTIKRRFLALNRDRLQRINSSLLWRQRGVLDLLPLLFQVNDEALPGFIGKDVPSGISNYKPPSTAIDAATRLNRNFKHSSRALSRYDIYSLFLTGSSGTIAHAKDSDFDIWVCHRQDMSEEAVALLESKSTAISEWCASLNLEVHFFIMDETRFRQTNIVTLDKESSGSALHLLLLEEFYRTSILLAGRMPLWWFVEPGQENNYDECAAELIRKKRVSDFEVIDFGPVNNIPAEEFFGASLWQIYKGIDSPYKSVLKILLMEAYANEYPNINLLCFNLKQAIYENKTSLAEIDPYIMICHKVEEYLLQRMEIKRLELARRCFYFKVDIPLSLPDSSQTDNAWRKELLTNLVKQWDWDDAHLLMLDSRPTWKIHRVLDERKSLVDELTRSYKLLSGFAREYASVAQINQKDMAILGRKLYAAFERKSGKIETINPGISDNLREELLSFHESSDSWLLFRGAVNNTEIRRNTPLKRARSIVELLCWCHFNHIIGPGTIISLYPSTSRLGLRELKNILATLNQHFPSGVLPETDTSQLTNKSQLTHSILFVNVGVDPESQHLSRDVQVISNRTDAFSYSGFFENLVISIDQVSINTWQEVYSQSFIGINEILDCLCRSIRMSSFVNDTLLPETHAYSFSSTKDNTVSTRVQEIFDNVIRFFHRPDMPTGARYILGVENNFYQLLNEPEHVDYHRLGTYDDLLSELGKATDSYSPTVFDDRTLTNHFLPVLYNNHTQGQIHIYIHCNGNKATLYIIDELGSLFVVHQDFYSMLSTISQFDSFFYSIKQRLNASGNSDDEYTLRFFALHKNPKVWLLREHIVDPLASPANPLHVTVIIESAIDPISYRVYCNDREFSSLEHGDAIFDQIAEFILTLRNDHSPYSLYISDIDIPSTTGDQLQSLQFLQYKTRFEQKLNDALLTAHKRSHA